jgi:hypothetical protein
LVRHAVVGSGALDRQALFGDHVVADLSGGPYA